MFWAGLVARREDGRWDERLLKWLPEGKRELGLLKIIVSDVLDAHFHEQIQLNRQEWAVYAGDQPIRKGWIDDFATFANDWNGQVLGKSEDEVVLFSRPRLLQLLASRGLF